MNFMLKYIIFLSHFLFICCISYTECVCKINKWNKINFANNIRQNKLSFVNSCYIPHSFVKSDVLYNNSRCKLLKEDDKLTHSDPFTQPPKTETNPVYKASNIKTLVLSRSSEVKENVTRFVKRVKESKGFKVLSDVLVKVKNRLSKLNVFEQFGLLYFGSYVFTYFLPKYHLVFPYQIFPIDSPIGLDIGLETLVSIPFMYYFLKDFKFSLERFKLPNVSPLRLSLVFTSIFASFFLSGYLTFLVDFVVIVMSAFGYPVSAATKSSISMISNHLFWASFGFLVIHNNLFPVTGKENLWYNFDLNETWVYKVLAGYINSSLVYRFSEFIYEIFIKLFKLEFDHSGVEETIYQVCSTNEIFPTVLVSLGPCFTAPWWEEILYRVFLFKSVNTVFSDLVSAVISSLLFALNHMAADSFFSLFNLGVLWSMINIKENNILINILIHSLWNSKVFLSNFIGH